MFPFLEVVDEGVFANEPVVPLACQRPCLQAGQRYAFAVPLRSNVRNFGLNISRPLVELAFSHRRRRVRFAIKLLLETRPPQAPVLLPDIVGQAFSGSIISVAVLSEADHPQNAFVYALVYSAAPE